MKILVVIPHYYKFTPGSSYGSTKSKDPIHRIRALTRCVMSFYQNMGHRQYYLDKETTATPANSSTTLSVDVVICTQGSNHLLNDTNLDKRYFNHVSFDVDPLFLGFECRKVLRDNLGIYDYYCYVEDDLIIHDPYFLCKIGWFTNCVHPLALLCPNRFELSMNFQADKCYIDNPVFEHNVCNLKMLTTNYWGIDISFVSPPENPHSGCYFLNHEQFDYWTKQSHYLSLDTSFVGPLESAATLGIMNTFDLYKPTINNACFLEIEHYGDNYLQHVGMSYLIAGELQQESI